MPIYIYTPQNPLFSTWGAHPSLELQYQYRLYSGSQYLRHSTEPSRFDHIRDILRVEPYQVGNFELQGVQATAWQANLLVDSEARGYLELDSSVLKFATLFDFQAPISGGPVGSIHDEDPPQGAIHILPFFIGCVDQPETVPSPRADVIRRNGADYVRMTLVALDTDLAENPLGVRAELEKTLAAASKAIGDRLATHHAIHDKYVQDLETMIQGELQSLHIRSTAVSIMFPEFARRLESTKAPDEPGHAPQAVPQGPAQDRYARDLDI